MGAPVAASIDDRNIGRNSSDDMAYEKLGSSLLSVGNIVFRGVE
jgi:hypothetical protein